MNRKVTFLDDLQSLQDLESNSNYYGGAANSSDSNSVKKYIRNNTYNPPFESGMSMSLQKAPQNNTEVKIYSNNTIPSEEKIEMENIINPYNQNNLLVKELNCINVAEHTSDCVVCSKIYRDDSAIYIFIIIFLLIVVMILLKNLFSVKQI